MRRHERSSSSASAVADALPGDRIPPVMLRQNACQELFFY
jgi:hypothetical protein